MVPGHLLGVSVSNISTAVHHRAGGPRLLLRSAGCTVGPPPCSDLLPDSDEGRRRVEERTRVEGGGRAADEEITRAGAAAGAARCVQTGTAPDHWSSPPSPS